MWLGSSLLRKLDNSLETNAIASKVVGVEKETYVKILPAIQYLTSHDSGIAGTTPKKKGRRAFKRIRISRFMILNAKQIATVVQHLLLPPYSTGLITSTFFETRWIIQN